MIYCTKSDMEEPQFSPKPPNDSAGFDCAANITPKTEQKELLIRTIIFLKLKQKFTIFFKNFELITTYIHRNVNYALKLPGDPKQLPSRAFKPFKKQSTYKKTSEKLSWKALFIKLCFNALKYFKKVNLTSDIVQRSSVIQWASEWW